MIIVSPDVLNPGLEPFIVGDHFVTQSDGSVAIALNPEETKFAGQEPNQYMVRHDADYVGAYQKFTKQANLLAVTTRPEDVTYVYTFVITEAYL
jgi:hypothetical protein